MSAKSGRGQFVIAMKARHLIASINPTPAKDCVAVHEKVVLRRGRSHHHIIVEVDEFVGKSRYPPKHRLDRKRVEGRQQSFEAAEYDLMVNDVNAGLFCRVPIEA